MTNYVHVEVDGPIAEVVLNRAEKMNALNENSFTELVAAAETVRSNKQIRVVIIRAEGDHFCAGADKAFLQGAVSDPEVFSAKALQLPEGEIANEFQKPVMVWLDINVPVLVCLQGVVYGAGMQLALAGDIRIASPTIGMSLFEINWGLIPDMGITQTLPRLVRADIASELMLTGRVVKADEAQRIGLVSRVEQDPLQATRELARKIASNSPDATSRAKKLLRDSVGLSTAQALKLEAELQSELVGTDNQIEAAMANLQKREAKFQSS